MFQWYFRWFFLSLLDSVVRSSNIKPTTAKPFSSILNKFHQNDYRIDFGRTELKRFNKSFGEIDMHTFKYNRTTPVVNGSFTLTVNMGYKVEVIAQAFRFASNEYRLFPLRFEVNVCQAIAESALGLDKLYKFGNIVCPLKKNTKYYFYNFAPEEANFPPLIPTGRYMIELQFIYNSEELFVSNNYLDVYRPVV